MTTTSTRSDDKQPRRRMVIFAGPHKSASSSVQELFMKFASNDPSRKIEWNHPSLKGWVWPWNPRRHSYQPRKGFAPLVTEGIGYHQLIWDTILQAWNETDATTGKFLSPHMIWGTEELDRFGTTPWSGRSGLKAMQEVYELTRPSLLEIVVNYRRPRKAQWISIWKQLMRKVEEGRAYGGFLCDPDEYQRIWEYLDCVANPLGLVEALLDFWDKTILQRQQQSRVNTKPSVAVHLLDMEGIATVNRDVGHVLACDVLKVNCTTDHWLPDVERPIVRNVKTGNPELTDEQMDEMEWVLQQRDCFYRQRLMKATSNELAEGHTRLSLHYADTLWDACSSQDDLSMYANTTFLLELLQSQVGCGNLKNQKNAIDELRKRQQNRMRSPQNEKPGSPSRPLTLPSNRTAILQPPPLFKQFPSANHPEMVQTAKVQLFVLYMLLVLVFGFLVRHLKCARGYMAQGRLAGRYQLARRHAT